MVFVHPVNQRLPAHTEITRSHGLVPVALLQGSKEHLFLEAAKANSVRGKVEVDGIDGIGVVLQKFRQIGDADLTLTCEDDNSFDHILQFADITGPSVYQKVIENAFGHPEILASVFGTTALKEEM